MASKEPKSNGPTAAVQKSPRALKVFAIDPETADREELGEWVIDDRWLILKTNGIGHYQEMLEEIAEELNEADELEFSNSALSVQVEPDWVDRTSANFGKAVAAYLKEQFDLEFA